MGLFDPVFGSSCRTFVQLSSKSLDEPLPFIQRVQHKLHRFMCKMCRVQEKRMKRIHALTQDIASPDGDSPRAEPPLELSPDSLARIRDAIKASRPKH